MRTHPIVEQSRRALELISSATKVPISDIVAGGRKQAESDARHIWFWLLYEHFGFTQQEVADEMDMDRWSVWHGVAKVRRNPELLAVARDVILAELVREDSGRAAA